MFEPLFVPAVKATDSCWLDAVMPVIVGEPGAASAIDKVNEFVEAVAPLESVIVATIANDPFKVGVPEIWQLNPL
jgi:hypothetical protein